MIPESMVADKLNPKAPGQTSRTKDAAFTALFTPAVVLYKLLISC